MRSRLAIHLVSLVFILTLLTPVIAGAQSGYQPLIGEAPELGIETGAGSNLSEFLTKMFAVLISITGILGVIMLVIGGIQYMTTDAVFGKSLGKQRIVSAGGGIILALSAWIILKTINPDLLENELDLTINAEIEQDEGNIGLTALQVGAPVPEYIVDYAYNSLSNADAQRLLGDRGDFDDLPLSTQIRLLEEAGIEQVQERAALHQYMNGSSRRASAILSAAQAAANQQLQTCGLDAGAQTNGGRLACAYTVNHIIEAATGRAIDNSLSTATMANSLAGNNRFTLVGSNLAQAQPGDIIISPTSRGVTGHVGIAETVGATTIISNSSGNTEVRRNYTADSWNERFNEDRNLGVQIYRAN